MAKHNRCSIQGVLFDFDGTLTQPGSLDFDGIRRAIGCPAGKSILGYLEILSHGEQKKARKLLDQLEMEGARRSVPDPDTPAVIGYLQENAIPFGVITRNGARPVKRALQNFSGLSIRDFAVMITRDDNIPPKPSAQGVLIAAATFGVSAAALLMVGDYIYDIRAGKKAGALTALLDPDGAKEAFHAESDFVLSSLADLVPIIQQRRAG